MSQAPVCMESIKLPAIATIGNVEHEIDCFYHAATSSPADIELDMSFCDFIEPATLILLIALLRQRKFADQTTQIRLPVRKDVRDFLRRWEFPQAVHDATGCSFFSMVTENDRRYFGENSGHDDMKYHARVIDTFGGRERLLSKVFYGIKTFFPLNLATDREKTVHAAMNQADEWKQEQVVDVLNRHLKKHNSKRIASHIVFEAIWNALRHPSAKIIQTTCHYQAPGEHSRNGMLTIVFWDDGESIVDTLQAGIMSGRGGTYIEAPELYADYVCKFEDRNGVAKPTTIRSDRKVDECDPRYQFLLASIFPGITSDITGREHLPNKELEEENKLLSLPGMGLFVLVNMTAAVLGGSVSIRTAEFFMSIKSGLNDSYNVKIRTYGSPRPLFLGNMLTIRFPLPERADHPAEASEKETSKP
jgi:hypothetical protein